MSRVFRDISRGARYACRLIIMLMSLLEDHLFSMGPRGHWPDTVLMLGQRLRRRPNNKPVSGARIRCLSEYLSSAQTTPYSSGYPRLPIFSSR